MKSQDELMKELEQLKAENEQLKTKKGGSGQITFKVSEKGAVSVYGMGRFPVTLYKEQWEKLLAKSVELLEFIKDHESQLKTKH